MTSFVEEYRNDLLTPTSLVVWTTLSVWLGLSGPFGTYEALPFGLRLLYWGGAIVVGMVVGSGARAFVTAVFPLSDIRKAALLSAALSSVMSTPVLYFFSVFMLMGRAPYVPSFFEVMVFVFAISLGVAAYRMTLGVRSISGAALAEVTAAGPIQRPIPRLLQRVEPCLRGDLISISVRDHYVDVLTTEGQASLLMRLSDAISEVAEVDGGQVHRSHWVAWSAVQAVEREGHKLFVRMPCGARLPVSRNHRDKVDARGLG